MRSHISLWKFCESGRMFSRPEIFKEFMGLISVSPLVLGPPSVPHSSCLKNYVCSGVQASRLLTYISVILFSLESTLINIFTLKIYNNPLIYMTLLKLLTGTKSKIFNLSLRKSWAREVWLYVFEYNFIGGDITYRNPGFIYYAFLIKKKE